MRYFLLRIYRAEKLLNNYLARYSQLIRLLFNRLWQRVTAGANRFRMLGVVLGHGWSTALQMAGQADRETGVIVRQHQ